MRKPQQRALDTQNRILAAAKELFASGGYAGTTVDAIAAGAGANKQRIYAYFGSKQQLFETVLIKLFRDVNLFSDPAMRRCPPEQLTEHLLAGFMRVHAEHPEFWRLLAWVNLDSAVRAEKLVEARAHENSDTREIFMRGRASGAIRPMEFSHYLYMLLALSWFYYSNRRTLEHTLSAGLYAPGGCEKLIAAASGLFRP